MLREGRRKKWRIFHHQTTTPLGERLVRHKGRGWLQLTAPLLSFRKKKYRYGKKQVAHSGHSDWAPFRYLACHCSVTWMLRTGRHLRFYFLKMKFWRITIHSFNDNRKKSDGKRSGAARYPSEQAGFFSGGQSTRWSIFGLSEEKNNEEPSRCRPEKQFPSVPKWNLSSGGPSCRCTISLRCATLAGWSRASHRKQKSNPSGTVYPMDIHETSCRLCKFLLNRRIFVEQHKCP